MEESMNTVNETAISHESETQSETANTVETVTQPEVQETGESTSAQLQEEGQHTSGDGTTAETPFLEIKYMKEMRGLSKDEAKNFAEIGMHYQGIRDKLERFATLKGMTVDEFISGLETAEDEAYKNSLMDKFGGDEETVDSMMELYNLKKQQFLDNAAKTKNVAAEAVKQNTNERIANEFLGMKKDFPELTEFSALPAEVKKAAIEGKALPYAYLEYKHKEAKKIAAAQNSAKAASEKSAGSMNTVKSDGGTQAVRQYLNALWSK